MQKTLINICGSERSGSTMLDLIIGNDPRAFSCGEIYALYRPWRQHHFQPACGCGRQDCEFLQAFRQIREDQFHSILFDQFSYDWIVDSSKDLTWVIDNQEWVTRNNGRVLNLAVWKKPATFSLSFLKRGKDAAHWRPIFINYYKQFLEAELPFVSVCYDDFIQSPEKHIKLICKILGMDYSENKMNFWEKEHHQLFGSGGTAGQVRQGVSKINRQVDIPPQFAEDVESVRRKSGEDPEVTAIIRSLKQWEISSLELDSEPLFNYDHTGKKRAWYYRQKMALQLRKYFPESYQH